MSQTMWDRVESPDPGNQPVRRFSWPGGAVEYTFTERVREAVPDGGSTFDSVERLAEQLHSIRGAGFEHSWRAVGDVQLSPSWLTLKSAVIDAQSERVVGVGHLTHGAFGMSAAHDLGALDGRNAFGFTEAGHGGGLWMPADALYIGSARTGALAPLDAGSNFISADLHAPTGEVGTMEFLGGGSTGCVALYDVHGSRRVLTVLDEVTGGEPIRFSPDGTWLLVAGSRITRLVEVSTGRYLRLEVGNAGWWPLDDSALLTIEHENGAAIPRIFSLATNDYLRTYPAIELDVPLLSTYPYVWFPAVSPDGTEVLGDTPAGVSPEFQQQHGVGGHLARFTLESGRGILVEPVFFDAQHTLERDVGATAWTRRAPERSVHLAPELEAALHPAVTSHEYLAAGRWADEAQRMLVLALNRAIALTQDGKSMAHLMPEILASIRAMAPSPESWSAQRDWLVGLLAPLGNMIVAGSITGADATAWSRFRSAILAVESGHADRIDSVAAIWSMPGAGEAESMAETLATGPMDGAALSGRRTKDELFALVQSWLNDPELVSSGSVDPEEFCSAVDELLGHVPEPGLLDQIHDFANRTSLMSWANSDLSAGLSEMPWGRIADGLEALRVARGWPEPQA